LPGRQTSAHVGIERSGAAGLRAVRGLVASVEQAVISTKVSAKPMHVRETFTGASKGVHNESAIMDASPNAEL
jgi:hypothetical protein